VVDVGQPGLHAQAQVVADDLAALFFGGCVI
jgi:hypothetical protein